MSSAAPQTVAAWSAIGTTALVQVSDPELLEPARTILTAELARIDAAASSYRADSELSRLLGAGPGVHAVSDALHEAVAVALEVARASDGLVDPTLGRGPHPSSIDLLGWAVRLPADSHLDLGASAKALCADRAARAIARAGEDLGLNPGVLVSLGGDIAVAGPAPTQGWLIRVCDDHRSAPDAPGQTVRIDGGALATSGTTVRRGPGGHGHHIIDPRTGAPARTPWRTVSVTAATCVQANTASTAAIVLAEAAPTWLEDRGLAARLVAVDGQVTHVGGWPEGAPMPAWAPAPTTSTPGPNAAEATTGTSPQGTASSAGILIGAGR
ncbi:MAG TPA: FAD:protein FMN transferase [Solirubrobacteraceae bacterium]|nr:FAD:protein FMN transferase [Solirubrobacteraceae bacterium]